MADENTPAPSPASGKLGELLASMGAELHADHECVPGPCQCLCGCRELLGCTLLFGALCPRCMVREMRDGSGGLHSYPGAEGSSEQVAQLLRTAARAYPRQRAMQILINALDAQGLARRADHSPKDLLFTDDAVLAQALRAYIAAASAFVGCNHSANPV